MIRFHIAQGDSITTTEWEEEPTQHGSGPQTAVARMTALRKTYGNDAAISIERTTVIPEPDRKQVRFKIVNKDGETRYSITFPIGEQDTRLAEIREKFPKATITAEVING